MLLFARWLVAKYVETNLNFVAHKLHVLQPHLEQIASNRKLRKRFTDHRATVNTRENSDVGKIYLPAPERFRLAYLRCQREIKIGISLQLYHISYRNPTRVHDNGVSQDQTSCRFREHSLVSTTRCVHSVP